tara:strand:- start:808 stop:999 length:192 start_codon:yes stop_codon:yes gene_type:complete
MEETRQMIREALATAQRLLESDGLELWSGQSDARDASGELCGYLVTALQVVDELDAALARQGK